MKGLTLGPSGAQVEGLGGDPQSPAAVRGGHLEEIPDHEIPAGRLHGPLEAGE